MKSAIPADNPNNASDIGVSRAWSQYVIKAVMSEKKTEESGTPWPEKTQAEIDSYKQSLAENFESSNS